MIGEHLTQRRVVLLRRDDDLVPAIGQQADGAIEMAHVRHAVQDEEEFHWARRALVVSAFRRRIRDSRFTIDLTRHAVRRVVHRAASGMDAVLDRQRLNGSIAVAIDDRRRCRSRLVVQYWT